MACGAVAGIVQARHFAVLAHPQRQRGQHVLHAGLPFGRQRGQHQLGQQGRHQAGLGGVAAGKAGEAWHRDGRLDARRQLAGPRLVEGQFGLLDHKRRGHHQRGHQLQCARCAARTDGQYGRPETRVEAALGQDLGHALWALAVPAFDVGQLVIELRRLGQGEREGLGFGAFGGGTTQAELAGRGLHRDASQQVHDHHLAAGVGRNPRQRVTRPSPQRRTGGGAGAVDQEVAAALAGQPAWAGAAALACAPALPAFPTLPALPTLPTLPAFQSAHRVLRLMVRLVNLCLRRGPDQACARSASRSVDALGVGSIQGGVTQRQAGVVQGPGKVAGDVGGGTG